MRTRLARCPRLVAIAIIAVFLTPAAARAQADALLGLLEHATDFNFYWTQVGIPRGSLKAERGSSAFGLGFELAFEIPGGIGRKRAPVNPRVRPYTAVARPDTASDCESRFRRNELPDNEPCADTAYKVVKRTRIVRGTTYEEEPVVTEFNWTPPVVTFEVAVGFSQAGALVSRDSLDELRASVREAPSLSLYGNFPAFHPRLGGYFGARTGLVQFAGAVAYIDGAPVKFDGSTFQVGPVLGAVLDFGGLNFFAEGSYMWRDIESIEWDTDASIGSRPRSADLSGASFALGVQFKFKADKE